MATTVPFTLITPTSVKFEGEAELVIATGTEGEFGILPHHAPFLTALRPGVMRANVVRDGAAQRLELATSEGFLQALPDKVTILVDAALLPDEVDVAAAQRSLEEATERQKHVGSDAEAFRKEQSLIDFASAQLRVTGHP